MVRPGVKTNRTQYPIIQHQWFCKKTLSYLRETGGGNGKPEMVEAALEDKLNNFPKISPKDPKKLYILLISLQR